MNKTQKQLNQKGFTQHHFCGSHKSGAGFSLFEILIAIAVFAVVGVTAAQLVSVSLLSDKTSGQKTVGVGFAQETMAAVNSVITEKWNNIYKPPNGGGDPVTDKGSTKKFYPANTAALCGSVKWCLVAGTASSTANNLTYKRDLYIENVNRDSGGNIVSSGGSDDPSTQKITVTVSWEDSGGNQLGSITLSNYFTRSRDAAAMQSDWTGGAGQADNPTSGETSNFNSGFDTQNNIDFSGGTLKLSQ